MTERVVAERLVVSAAEDEFGFEGREGRAVWRDVPQGRTMIRVITHDERDTSRNVVTIRRMWRRP